MVNLVSTPDFDGLTCLRILKFIECPKLRKIHPSLGNHTSLQHIHISYCEKLRKFPIIVCMENLKTLEIYSCPRMLHFPEIQSDMKNLECLDLFKVGIDVLPWSIGERCTNLITLKLVKLIDVKRIEFKFDSFKQLKKLNMIELGQGNIMTERQLFRQCRRMLYRKYVKIPSSIVQLSNLQELYLEHNASRLDFSLSQLTQLKRLDVSGWENLVELPDLPSSLTILHAPHCRSLVTLGDCYKNCIGLCQVSLLDAGIISDGDKLVEFMLDHPVCIADNNNYCMYVELKGVEVAKGFGVTSPLVRGRRCRLELPDNWYNDFSGFLICVVSGHRYDARITMEQMTSGMDSDKDDVVWEVSDDGDHTWVVYVSFGILGDTTWWNPTHKALQFDYDRRCSGFGVRLVEKKRPSGVKETFTNYPSFSSHYTPKIEIWEDSESALTINLRYNISSDFTP